mgnify:CR=1 FL=1|jgi:hypothetical protein
MFNNKVNLYTWNQPLSWNKITDTGIIQIKQEYANMVDKYLSTREELRQLNEKYQVLEKKNQHLQQVNLVMIKKNTHPHHLLE